MYLYEGFTNQSRGIGGTTRSGFAMTPGWPMGFLGFADATTPFGGDSALQQWAAKLSTEWAKRKNKSVKEIENRLDLNMKYTLATAAKRRGGAFLKKHGTPAIISAWKISQEQLMDFETLDKSKGLDNFRPPPAHSVQLMVSPLVKDGHGKVTPLVEDDHHKPAAVAPLVVAFMQKLRQIHPTVRADTYPNHGGGAFSGRGFSIDLWLVGSPIDARGFWRHEDAVALLHAVHQAARAVGAEWRVLYNDYSVARVLNQKTGKRRVAFVNFHGPRPLVLHFHLDLAPLPGAVAGAPTPMSPSSSQPGVSKPSVASSIASLPKILADAVKSGALTLEAVSRILAGERDVNILTNLIFYARHPKLPAGYKIQRHEKELAREWLDIRDRVVRPVLDRLSASRPGLPVSQSKPHHLPGTGGRCPHSPFAWAKAVSQKMTKWWSGPVGATLREMTPKVFPSVPVEAIVGFCANGGVTENTTEGVPAQKFHEIGLFGTEAGLRGGPAPNPNPIAEYNSWGKLANDPVIKKLLGGRAATMKHNEWKTKIPDQVAIGLVNIRRHGNKVVAALDPSIRPDSSTSSSIFFVACCFMGWSAGDGTAARHLNKFKDILASVPEEKRWGTFLRALADGINSGRIDLGGLRKHQSVAYSALRTWQKLAAGQLLARQTGGLVHWFNTGLGTDEASIAETITCAGNLARH